MIEMCEMPTTKHVRVKWLEKNPLCIKCMKNGYYIKATAVAINGQVGPMSLCDKHIKELSPTNFKSVPGRGKRKKMKKAMLSQPMAGKTDEEIVATRERAIKVLKEKGYEVVNTLFTDEWYSKEAMEERGVVQIPLCFLAKSLENMSCCHAAYFCKGWEKARGCRIEHEAAVAYGLDRIYEEQPNGCTDNRFTDNSFFPSPSHIMDEGHT